MRRAIPLIALLLAGLLGFWLTLHWVPGFIMSRATERLMAGGAGLNLATHALPVSETSRGVVRPSPDILYSICPFDVSDAPLLIEIPWPEDGSYASLSLYDARTNNFTVVSNRNGERGATSLLLTARSGAAPPPETATGIAHRVEAPSARGIALYRRVVGTNGSIDIPLQERAGFRCGALTRQAPSLPSRPER